MSCIKSDKTKDSKKVCKKVCKKTSKKCKENKCKKITVEAELVAEKKAVTSQKADVKAHLLSGKTITQKECTDLYGAQRLAALIFDLKHDDKMEIKKNMLSVPTRHGRNSRIAEYYI